MIENLLIHNDTYQNVVLAYSSANKINKHSGEKIIGFGNVEGFYLYWITKSDQNFIFASRIKYNKELKYNRVSYQLTKENKSIIQHAMYRIIMAYKNNDTIITKKETIAVNIEKTDTISKESINKLSNQINQLNNQLQNILNRISALEKNFSSLIKKDQNESGGQISIKVESIMHESSKKTSIEKPTHNKVNSNTSFYGHRFQGLPSEIDIRGKIKCTFCNTVFLDTLDECPYCKASITEIYSKK